MIFENRCPVFLFNIQGFKGGHLNLINRKCLIGSSAYRHKTNVFGENIEGVCKEYNIATEYLLS